MRNFARGRCHELLIDGIQEKESVLIRIEKCHNISVESVRKNPTIFS